MRPDSRAVTRLRSSMRCGRHGSGRSNGRTLQSWSPTIEVMEKDNRLITRVDLPGVKKEDVKVEVADNRLTILRRTEA